MTVGGLTVIAEILLFSMVAIAHADNWEAAKERCKIPLPTDPVLHQEDTRWNLSHSETHTLFNDLYESPKRLYGRAYYEEARRAFLLSNDVNPSKAIRLPLNHIELITRHIERALESGLAEFVFFPDMGHSHYLIPMSRWISTYQSIPIPDVDVLYETMFQDPSVKVLYHTAEQMTLLDADSGHPLPDRQLQWRFFTRNLVGANNEDGHVHPVHASDSRYNTLGDLPGYRFWGAGFYISSNKDGCFSYQTKTGTRYFDITLKSPPPRIWNLAEATN